MAAAATLLVARLLLGAVIDVVLSAMARDRAQNTAPEATSDSKVGGRA